MPDRNNINMFPINVNSNLQIQGYADLIKRSEAIEKKYKGFIGTEKQCRALRRRINKVSRELNNLRKEKARPYRKALKHFKAQIDVLRQNVKVVSSNMSKQIDMYAKRDADKIKQRCKPSWEKVLAVRGLKPRPVPDDIVAKKSYTRKNRTDIMVGIANTLRQKKEFANAMIIHGKPVTVNKSTGEMKPIQGAVAKKFSFVGTKLQWLDLISYAKKDDIQLKVDKSNK